MCGTPFMVLLVYCIVSLAVVFPMLIRMRKLGILSWLDTAAIPAGPIMWLWMWDLRAGTHSLTCTEANVVFELIVLLVMTGSVFRWRIIAAKKGPGSFTPPPWLALVTSMIGGAALRALIPPIVFQL